MEKKIETELEKKIPIHETLLIGALLAMAAGGLDAYTYLLHGEVFAGLQTGNLILLGIHLLKSDGTGISRYLIAIFSFMIGTILIRLLQEKYDHAGRGSVRQAFVIAWEIICMLFVAVCSPILPDHVAAAFLSIAAAAQLQEFRKLKGGPFTSLMMTGNVRTLAASLFEGFVLKDKKALGKAWDILIIILSFVIGAAATAFLADSLGNQTILLSALLLLCAMFILLTKKK